VGTRGNTGYVQQRGLRILPQKAMNRPYFLESVDIMEKPQLACGRGRLAQ
jgi:hypothetical protein